MEVNHEVMLLAGAELLGFVCLQGQSRGLCDGVARGGPGLIVGQQSGTLLVTRSPSTPCWATLLLSLSDLSDRMKSLFYGEKRDGF